MKAFVVAALLGFFLTLSITPSRAAPYNYNRFSIPESKDALTQQQDGGDDEALLQAVVSAMVASALDEDTKSGETADLLEAAMMQEPGSDDEVATEMRFRLRRLFGGVRGILSPGFRNRLSNGIGRAGDRIRQFLQGGSDGGTPVTEGISNALNAALMQEPEGGDDEEDMATEMRFRRLFSGIRNRLRNVANRFLRGGSNGGGTAMAEDTGNALEAVLMQEPEGGDDKDMNAQVMNLFRRILLRRLG